MERRLIIRNRPAKMVLVWHKSVGRFGNVLDQASFNFLFGNSINTLNLKDLNRLFINIKKKIWG